MSSHYFLGGPHNGHIIEVAHLTSPMYIPYPGRVRPSHAENEPSSLILTARYNRTWKWNYLTLSWEIVYVWQPTTAELQAYAAEHPTSYPPSPLGELEWGRFVAAANAVRDSYRERTRERRIDNHATSSDAHSVRFSELSKEAEEEMEEWDRILHPKKEEKNG